MPSQQTVARRKRMTPLVPMRHLTTEGGGRLRRVVEFERWHSTQRRGGRRGRRREDNSVARGVDQGTEKAVRTSGLTLVGLPVRASMGHQTVRAVARRLRSAARNNSVYRSN